MPTKPCFSCQVVIGNQALLIQEQSMRAERYSKWFECMRSVPETCGLKDLATPGKNFA